MMRHMMNRKAFSLHAILLSALLSSCATREPPVEAPPQLTAEEAAARLAQIGTSIPERSASPEWQNLQVYLRKAQFLMQYYRPSDPVLDMVNREIGHAETSLAALQACNPAPPPPTLGEREEGYACANDASFQPFLRYLPPSAKKGRKMPMIVYLHGYSPYLNIANWADFPSNLVEFARTEGFCLVAPFGRSNTDFQGIGEQDVLRAMNEMIKRYPIDEDRIILAGISMGGMGVWTIGAHYPDLFAGLLILAGRGDYYFWQKVDRADLPAYKQRLIDTEFAASLLPNLRNIPIFCAHGEKDSLVPVEEARHIVQAAREEKLDVTYTEVAGADHWIFEEMFGRKETRNWLKKRRRTMPAEFTYRTYHPKYNRCRWITGIDVIREAAPAEVTVHVANEEIVIEARGVRSLAIDQAKMPRRLRRLFIVKQGAFDLATQDPAAAPARGPVKEAFLAPFIFVYAGNPADTNGVARFRQRLVEWYRYSKSFPVVAYEKGLTAEELGRYNVFLFGEPEESALVKKVLDSSPLRIAADDYVVGDQKFPRKGNGLCFVYRNPWNPDRLAVVQCGLPWGAGLGENHRYDFLPDYIVYSAEQDADGSNHALCAGFWNDNWNP